MASTVLMQGLLVVYFAIAVLAAWEGNWPRVLYWCSAFGITSSVIWGMR